MCALPLAPSRKRARGLSAAQRANVERQKGATKYGKNAAPHSPAAKERQARSFHPLTVSVDPEWDDPTGEGWGGWGARY